MFNTGSDRYVPRWLLAAVYVVIGASALTAGALRQEPKAAPKPAASATPAKAVPDPVIKDEDELAKLGEETVNKTCDTQCHGLENLDSRRTIREWNDLVAQMMNKGATATDRQVAIIKQYLNRYYGLVAINMATAEEISPCSVFRRRTQASSVSTAHGKLPMPLLSPKCPASTDEEAREQPTPTGSGSVARSLEPCLIPRQV